MHINENIKRFRELANASQQDIADKLGIKRTTYAGWEKEIVPQADILERMAGVFGVTIDEILAKPDEAGKYLDIRGQLMYQNALLEILVSEISSLKASASGEHPSVVQKQLLKAARDIIELRPK